RLSSYCVHMNTVEMTDWTARTVTQAIKDAGMTVLEVSENCSLTRPTLIRKLRGFTPFTFPELLEIAAVLRVHPSTFTPPLFREHT
ncbi:hypothetical protein, partial [Denitromonas sp.]|uniref:hypothetical protein n=1 Tax=Denitromonas sp. TaxID=2734609 RepID=UPI003A862615